MDKITAIYIRVSTDRQAEEGYSIDAQTEQLEALCVAKQWNNHKLYIDGGWSGSNIDRPEMRKLIEDINKKLIERVVVYKLDRLSRSQKDVLYLIEDVFMPNNIDFVSHTESLDTSTAMGRAMIGIMAAFAQLERENIKMRTQMGMLERIKEGYWMGGGRIPFGYNYDKNLGTLVPNEDAKKVKQMYKLYLEGYGAQTIANMLDLKYERLVSQILMRKSNYGVIEYKGEIYNGRHEPIISKETYDAAMLEMKRRSANSTTSTSAYLLTGLLECGKCGAKMRYQKCGKYMKLICYSQQTSKPYLVKDPNCNLCKHRASDIEEAVLAKLKSVKFVHNTEENIEPNSTLNILLEQRAELEKKIKKLFNLYATMEDEMLLDTINENKRQLKTVNEQIEQQTVSEELYNVNDDELVDGLDNIENRWDTLTPHQQQRLMRIMIKKITVLDDEIKVTLNMKNGKIM